MKISTTATCHLNPSPILLLDEDDHKVEVLFEVYRGSKSTYFTIKRSETDKTPMVYSLPTAELSMIMRALEILPPGEV
jgi:hypothetical protein